MLKKYKRILIETSRIMRFNEIRFDIIFYYIFYPLSLLAVVIVSNLERLYVDYVLEKHSYSALFFVVIVLLVVSFIASIINYFLKVQKQKINLHLIDTLKIELLKKIFDKPINYVNEIDTDDLKMRIDTDSVTMVNFYIDFITSCIPAAISFLTFCILMFLVEPLVSAILIVFVIISNVIDLRLGKVIDKHNIVLRKQNNEINNLMYSDLNNFVPYKMRNLQEPLHDNFVNEQNKLKKTYYVWMIMHVKFIVWGLVKADFIQKVVIYLIGAVSVLSGKLSIGSTVLLLNYFLSLSGHLSKIINFIVSSRSNMNSYERCLELLQTVQSKKTILKDPILCLAINNLYFAYNNQPDILHGINLKINAREKVAIVGGNGQGKSTLIKCIAQIEKPTKGDIKINGVDVYDIGNYYHLITITMQDATLFNLSVWDNLTLGDVSLSREKVTDVCEKVGILHDIQSMDEGFETKIDINGSNLSGGQRQKIIIARALLRKNAGILIFDEANSAIDSDSEERINSYLLKCSDKSIIIISHRQTTIDRFDNKYILDAGEMRAL